MQAVFRGVAVQDSRQECGYAGVAGSCSGKNAVRNIAFLKACKIAPRFCFNAGTVGNPPQRILIGTAAIHAGCPTLKQQNLYTHVHALLSQRTDICFRVQQCRNIRAGCPHLPRCKTLAVQHEAKFLNTRDKNIHIRECPGKNPFPVLPACL